MQASSEQNSTSATPRVYLAPMEGVVDSVIRNLYGRIGGYDQFTTEFVRVTSRLLPEHVFYRYCPELKNGGKTLSGVPVFLQILGGDATLMAESAAMAVELGAPGIDINFGCPAKTVNKHDGGAAILQKPRRVYEIVKAVREAVAVDVPVTAKVRLGYDHKHDAVEIAGNVGAAGADALTIHARTKTEGYRPPAHWHYIRTMKEAAGIRVIANGDIWSFDDYLRCREISGCSDVALGRSGMATPNLARIIKQQDVEAVSWQEIQHRWFPIFLQECYANRRDKELYPTARLKQWLCMLTPQYPEAKLLLEQIKRIRDYAEMLQAVQVTDVTGSATATLSGSGSGSGSRSESTATHAG